MANRMFKPLEGSLTQGLVCLTGSWTFDSSGVPSKTAHEGFSVDTATAGAQTITLEDKYNSLAGLVLTYQGDGSFLVSETTTEEILTETVSTTKTINIQYIALDDGNVQPHGKLAGITVRCMIWLKNSSV